MILTSMMRPTTMVGSPCYSRRGADDPWMASLSACAGALSDCPPFEPADHHLPPGGTTMTSARVGVLRHRWAEADEEAAEHETCLFPRRHCQEEGEGRPSYCEVKHALVPFGRCRSCQSVLDFKSDKNLFEEKEAPQPTRILIKP